MKFRSVYKNRDDQCQVDQKKAIEANLVSSNQRVSGEFGISQSSVGRHLHDFG